MLGDPVDPSEGLSAAIIAITFDWENFTGPVQGHEGWYSIWLIAGHGDGRAFREPPFVDVQPVDLSVRLFARRTPRILWSCKEVSVIALERAGT